MASLSDAAPEFSAEVAAALCGIGRTTLASQLVTAEISRATYDADADAGYIYLRPPVPALPGVHREAAPVRETVPFEGPHWFNVDVDHEGYAFGVEVLGRMDLIERLRGTAAV